MFRAIFKTKHSYEYRSFNDAEFFAMVNAKKCTMPEKVFNEDFPIFIEPDPITKNWDWAFQWKFEWVSGCKDVISMVPDLLVIYPDGPNSNQQFEETCKICGITFH